MLTLTPEDAELFEALHQNYIQRFEPRDQAEHDLIEEAVTAKWQLREAQMMHARTLRLQMVSDASEVDARWDPITLIDRQTLAFAKSLENGKVLPTLERYMRQLSTQSERAIKLFLKLRDHILPPPAPVQFDPSPEPAPPETPEPNEPETLPPDAPETPDSPSQNRDRPNAPINTFNAEKVLYLPKPSGILDSRGTRRTPWPNR